MPNWCTGFCRQRRVLKKIEETTMIACRKCDPLLFLQMLVLALGMLFPWQAQAAMHDGFVHVSDQCQNII